MYSERGVVAQNFSFRNPQTGQMVPPCMEIKPMEGWCLENSELCQQRIKECHDLMESNTASVGTGNALLVFLIIARKYHGICVMV